jgi:hypothetical protein
MVRKARAKKMGTWYVPIEQTVKIGDQHRVEDALGRFLRPHVHDNTQVEIHHLVVVKHETDEPIGITTDERVREYLLRHPTKIGNQTPRPQPISLCMASRGQILEFLFDKPKEEIRKEVMSNWDFFRPVRAIFLVDSDNNVVGFATDYDIFIETPP